MAKFERVSKYSNSTINMPQRKTVKSAGYDFEVLEDTLVEPYAHLSLVLSNEIGFYRPVTLDEVAAATKKTRAKPSLVATGVKCRMPERTYLELNIRSSAPLKYWLMLANSVGVIDADYYNNPDNEGEIFFQIINLSPYPIVLKKGDIIGQGIFKEYLTTEDDVAEGVRVGGFGSTSK
jgi:dUTP pyrophosphatase